MISGGAEASFNDLNAKNFDIFLYGLGFEFSF